MIAVEIITNEAIAIVNGSFGTSSNNKSLIKRVLKSTAGKPTQIPIRASSSVSRITNLKTLAGCAPKARRMPISRVRRVTA